MTYRSVWLTISLGILALCLSAGATAQDACSFKSGGDKATGQTFGAGVTVPGVTARDALAQIKDISAKGYDADQGNFQGSQGTLTIHQRATGSSRGFPLFVTATDAGAVNIDMTLPAGMMAKPDDVRREICGMLALVKPRSGTATAAVPDTHASTSSVNTSALPSAAQLFGPVDSTKLCLTNFTMAMNESDGNTYSTWTMAPSIDPHDAIATMKKFIAGIKDYEVLSEEYHGHEGELVVAMKTAAAVRQAGLSGPGATGFPFHVTVDGDLAAISYVAQVNPDQTDINTAHMEYMACGLIAGATHSELPPDLSKTGGNIPPPGSSRLANLFKTRKTLVKEATQQAKDKLKARHDASATLYGRAIASGKAVVVMPMVGIGEKYKSSGIPLPGADAYPEYSIDRNSTIIWQKNGEPNALLKAGYTQSMDRVGLHGYLTGIDAGKSYYMFYIVEPGTYSLVGNTYKLLRANFPDMTAKQWQAKPKIGLASLSATKEKEYYQTQEWFAAQYGTRTVSDGTYCDMMIIGGAGGGGCAHVSEATHNETVTTDPGGWRNVTHAKMVDGVAVATKLTRPFATVSIGAGEALVVDGFYNDSNAVSINTDGCNQADSNLVNCSIKNYTLYRIASRINDLNDGPSSFMDDQYLINNRMPFSKDLFKTRQVNVSASPAEGKLGTFESGWAKPYSLSSP